MHVLWSSAHADDNSGPGGLLLEEIPGILNIGADREPVAGEITIRQPQGRRRFFLGNGGNFYGNINRVWAVMHKHGYRRADKTGGPPKGQHSCVHPSVETRR